MKIRVMLVDDHAVVRAGLRMMLESEEEFDICSEASTASEAIVKTAQDKPDVILMDIGLPDMTGIDATKEIKRAFPEIPVVALTIHEDEEYFFKMLDAGASGYVPKRAAPEELLSAIRAAYSGEVYLYPSLAKLLVRDFLSQQQESAANTLNGLTAREEEVLALLAEGESNTEIAEKLTISPKTVARHRENIMNKLNLHSRTDLVKYAIRKGIIEP
jgi:two-component system response regulator NreC